MRAARWRVLPQLERQGGSATGSAGNDATTAGSARERDVGAQCLPARGGIERSRTPSPSRAVGRRRRRRERRARAPITVSSALRGRVRGEGRRPRHAVPAALSHVPAGAALPHAVDLGPSPSAALSLSPSLARARRSSVGERDDQIARSSNSTRISQDTGRSRGQCTIRAGSRCPSRSGPSACRRARACARRR